MVANERSYLCWVTKTTSLSDGKLPAELIMPAVKTGKNIDMILVFLLLIPKLRELKFHVLMAFYS